uniref:Tripeptidyl-peptidase 2 n=1 Tax=Graphocephala atropunctata TaxID=36148 RepID=A0A1B6LQD6_9HEMI
MLYKICHRIVIGWCRVHIVFLNSSVPLVLIRSISLTKKVFKSSVSPVMDLVTDFPTSSLLPKKETGAAAFVNRYPEYDGKGTVIAIFDSGIDPGASGLQLTSDDKPKIIGRYDCSGAGDVDTSAVLQSVDGVLQGLTGRKLKVPPSWKNPTGNYHLGVKCAFEIYPKKVQERLTKERKDKLWDPEHKTALGDATRNLNAINKEQEANKSSTVSREEKLKKDEAEALVDVLNTLEKKYNDVGPVYDCVVFHDGEMWRACLDTSEKGDLESCHVLGEYSKTRDFVSISASDQVNYSINVHDEGKILEIVGVSSTHGTHVACIAAANFPDAPEKNGVAPGAQLVSLCIGDNRLDTMETGTAIVRSMIHVMNSASENGYKIDIINMSYGENAHFSSTGRIGELMAEVVDKYGVVWVAAAGNHGPALCTVNTPPNIAVSNIIGVGAYVSPDMMQAEYSLRQKLPGMPFTWSSRGPTIDGDKGVSVCAPGAAITSVSCFTLRGSQLINGTSMASPHAAGCVALLLSGLKAQGLPYSPYSVKRALENTALFLESMDPFAQGYGLLQVEKAFDNLVNYHNTPERDIRFHISCGPGNNKGIHIRSGIQDVPKEYGVTVEPFFADADNVEAEKKIEFQISLVLACSAPWVQYPSHLEMMNIARVMSIRVDPTGLSPGVHNTCLRAYDVNRPERGPVFRVEVTVVQPQVLDSLQPELVCSRVHFDPNTIQRHFLLVPDPVSWAVIRLRGQDRENFGRFVVHCIQLRPKRSCRALEFHKMVNVSAQSEAVVSFQVKGGVVLEVVIAKYWANLGSMNLNYKVEMHGCRPDSPVVTMVHADGIHGLELYSGLQSEEVSPNIQIKSSVSALRPTEAKVLALDKRDVIPPGRQIYQLLLTYTFHLSKSFEVTPNSSLLSHLLYESEFESQLWMLFDCNKQLLASGDAYPNKYSVKLEKGDYTIKHQIRHEKKDLLEKLTDLPILLSHKLATPITVDAYGNQSQALVGGKKLTLGILPSGKHTLPIYIAPLASDKLQKIGTTGHYLQGTITYSKDEIGKKVDSYPFKYILVEPGKKSSSKNNNEKTKQEEYDEALRDLQVSWLSKLDNSEAAEQLYKELCGRYTDHLAVHTAMLAHLEPDTGREWPGSAKPLSPAQLARLQTVAQSVITAVDTTDLLVHIGTKSDQRPDAPKIKIMMDRQKTALIDALARYGSVQCRLYKATLEADVPKPTLEDIDKTYLELVRFSDNNDKVTGHFTVWHACVHQQYGRMLKVLAKLAEDKPSKELEEATVWGMRQLGWRHAADLFSATTPVRHPSSYRLF